MGVGEITPDGVTTNGGSARLSFHVSRLTLDDLCPAFRAGAWNKRGNPGVPRVYAERGSPRARSAWIFLDYVAGPGIMGP